MKFIHKTIFTTVLTASLFAISPTLYAWCDKPWLWHDKEAYHDHCLDHDHDGDDVPRPTPKPTPKPKPTPTPKPVPTPCPVPKPTPRPIPVPTPKPAPPVSQPTPQPSPVSTPAPSSTPKSQPNPTPVATQASAATPSLKVATAAPSPTPEPTPKPVHPLDGTVQQPAIDGAAVITNSIEQRASELRDLAEQRAQTTEETPAHYSKDGKDVVVIPAVEHKLTKRWDIWAIGTGVFGHYGSGNADTGQITIGADYRITPTWIIGVLADYGYTTGTFRGSHFTANTFRGGLYTSWWHGGFYLTGAALAGVTEYSARGHMTGNDFTLYAGTGYMFHAGSFEFGPVASLEYDYADGFRPLRELTSRVGARVAYHARLTPFVQVAWQHQLRDTWTGIDRNAAWVSAGLDYAISERWNCFASYSIAIGQKSNVQQVDIGLAAHF